MTTGRRRNPTPLTEAEVEAEVATWFSESRACPECGKLCLSRSGMTRHRMQAHGLSKEVVNGDTERTDQ